MGDTEAMSTDSEPTQMGVEHLRARRQGDALKIVKKLEERYDAEDYLGTPERVVDWMNEVLRGEHPTLEIPPPTKQFRIEEEATGWKKINFWLRDGVALCKFINKLLISDGKKPIKYNPNGRSAFVALENIEQFNHGAMEYGLPEYECFNSIDLYEADKGPFLNVINCLNKLGFEANKKGFEPYYEVLEPPARDTSWDGH